MAHDVTRGERNPWGAPEDRLAGTRLRTAALAGAANSSVHLEIRLCELPPGCHLPPHFHPFEESFYVLTGGAAVSVADTGYRLAPGDYGFAPVATPHAWRNDTGTPVRWLEARAPQPRTIGRSAGTYLADDHDFPATLREPDETDPRSRYVGRFDDGDMAPYGPLTMPGYHGPNIRSISIRMLVDQLLGAQHHTLFMVEFAPRAGRGQAAKEHFHPFEETYYLLSGTALGTLDGEQVRVGAGDLVWTGANSSHGFVNDGDEPVRWLEVQSPVPPTSDAFFFDDDWRRLDR